MHLKEQKAAPCVTHGSSQLLRGSAAFPAPPLPAGQRPGAARRAGAAGSAPHRRERRFPARQASGSGRPSALVAVGERPLRDAAAPARPDWKVRGGGRPVSASGPARPPRPLRASRRPYRRSSW